MPKPKPNFVIDAINIHNSKKHCDNTSGYKGVTQKEGKYQASIRNNGKLHYIGLFNTAIEAAKAYDAEAIKLHKNFANVNFKSRKEVNH